MLYDVFGYELGAGFVLPDGRAFFIGSTPYTALYTPSGDTSKGTWAEGPPIPDSLGAVDAAAAMMPNGKILCALSHQAVHDTEFLVPAWFYEFNYLTDSFTEVSACAGGDSMNIRCSETGMLDLPDGNILVSVQNSNQYYIYVPGGTPVASGVPVVSNIPTTTMPARSTGTAQAYRQAVRPIQLILRYLQVCHMAPITWCWWQMALLPLQYRSPHVLPKELLSCNKLVINSSMYIPTRPPKG